MINFREVNPSLGHLFRNADLEDKRLAGGIIQEMGFMKGQYKREIGLSIRSPRAGKKLVLRSCSGVGGCSKDGGM